MDHDFGIEGGVFELFGGEGAIFPARSLIGFVHEEAKFAQADGFERMPAGIFRAVALATDLHRIGDILNRHAVFFEHARLELGVVDDFDDIGMGEDVCEVGEIDGERVDEERLRVATDLNEAQVLVVERRFDVETDVGLFEDDVECTRQLAVVIDVGPRVTRVHDLCAIAAFDGGDACFWRFHGHFLWVGDRFGALRLALDVGTGIELVQRGDGEALGALKKPRLFAAIGVKDRREVFGVDEGKDPVKKVKLFPRGA